VEGEFTSLIALDGATPALGAAIFSLISNIIVGVNER